MNRSNRGVTALARLAANCASRNQYLPAQGSDQNVAELYGALRLPLSTHLGSFGLSGDEVEDTIQEAFVRLMCQPTAIGNRAKIDAFREPSRSGRLFRVAHSIVADRYHDSVRMPPAGRSDVEPIAPGCVDPAPDPEQCILREEKLAWLDEAISRLSCQQRSCFLLRAQGLGYKQIGSILGIRAQQAAKLLREGLGLLIEEFVLSSFSNRQK